VRRDHHVRSASSAAHIRLVLEHIERGPTQLADCSASMSAFVSTTAPRLTFTRNAPRSSSEALTVEEVFRFGSQRNVHDHRIRVAQQPIERDELDALLHVAGCACTRAHAPRIR